MKGYHGYLATGKISVNGQVDVAVLDNLGSLYDNDTSEDALNILYAGATGSYPSIFQQFYWPKNKSNLKKLIGDIKIPAWTGGIVGLIPTKTVQAWAEFPEDQTSVSSPGTSPIGVAPNGWTLNQLTTASEGHTVWKIEGIEDIQSNTVNWGAPEIATTAWLKPGTTLIDGNKIFSGEAYVDTLQIKGNAVTLNIYQKMSSSVAVGGTEQTVWTATYPTDADAGYVMNIVVIMNLRIGTLVPASGWEPFYRWKFRIKWYAGGVLQGYIYDTSVASGDGITLVGSAENVNPTVSNTFELEGTDFDGSGSVKASALMMGIKR